MSTHARNQVIAALVLLAFGAGYSLAWWQYRRVAVPPRSVAGATVPPGVASDLRAALLHEDSFERTARVSQILEPLGPEALADVRSAYESVILDLGDIELVQLVTWWARFDPQSAFNWARESWIGWHPAVLQAAMRAWGRIDPETAVEQLTKWVADDRLSNAGMIGLVRGWEESGRPGLEDLLADPGKDESHLGMAIDSLVRARFYRGGPDAAVAWAEGLPDAEDGTPTAYKQRVFKRLATVLVAVDPKAAGDWVARHRNPTFGIGLLLRVGVPWAEKDGAAAMGWLSTLPMGDDLPVVVQETYRKWYTVDLPAASEWIRKQPLEPWLDGAVDQFAMWRAVEDPREATEWAGRIQDAHRRELAYGKIALLWLGADPEAAQAWLDRADLPESTRAWIAKLRELRLGTKGQPAVRAPLLPAPQGGDGIAPGAAPPPG